MVGLTHSPRCGGRWTSRTRERWRERAIGSMRSEAIRSVIRAYDDPIVRAYCWGRFWILRQRFLDEIGQYLPARGRVLDLGCGFGLFSLYYASAHPALTVEGFDLNPRRIEMARAAARRLGLGNVRYEVGDVMAYRAVSASTPPTCSTSSTTFPRTRCGRCSSRWPRRCPRVRVCSSRTWIASRRTSGGAPTRWIGSWIRARRSATGARRSGRRCWRTGGSRCTGT